MTRVRSLKVCLYSSFAIICFVQSFLLMRSFLNYPTVIDLYDVSPNLISICPAITVCNNNRMSLRKLTQRDKTIRDYLEQKFPSWYHNNQKQLGTERFNLFRDELSKLYERINFAPQDVIDNSTITELFEMKPNSSTFIRWVGCAKNVNAQIDCQNLSKIDSVQGRICTTMLHDGAIKYDRVNRPYLFNSSDLKWDSNFDAKDVVKIFLEFEPEDYADLKRQIGARISFHDSRHVASGNELDFFVTRGFHYYFNIKRVDTHYLGSPYSPCLNYSDIYLDHYKDKIDPRVPLTVETCFQNCVVVNIIENQKCWPTIMPYFRNDSIKPNPNLRTCGAFGDVGRMAAFKETVRIESLMQDLASKTLDPANLTESPRSKARAKQRSYRRIRRYCWTRCMLPCRKPNFSVSVSRSIWPTDAQISLDPTGKIQNVRHSNALITVKYSYFHYTVQEHKPKYYLLDTLGNIGGLLAVWMGISIVSIYNGLQRCIQFFVSRPSSKVDIFNRPNVVSTGRSRTITPSNLQF